MTDVRQEIVQKVTALVQDRFGGDWPTAFRHYAEPGADEIGLVGVVRLLADSGVGSRWTRSMIGRAIIRELDTNESGTISVQEFRTRIEEPI